MSYYILGAFCVNLRHFEGILSYVDLFSSSFGSSHLSGVARVDVFQTSVQKIWQCFTPDALLDIT